jgi:hypothetical protein
VTNPAELHDQLVIFMQEEHRCGFLLAVPLTVCTIGFWEHISEFIASQACERCPQLEARVAHLNREIANCQRWLRWLLRYRGGPGHVRP